MIKNYTVHQEPLSQTITIMLIFHCVHGILYLAH